MSELEPESGDIGFVAFAKESELHTADGTVVIGGTVYSNMDTETQREVLARSQGLQPEGVIFPDEDPINPATARARRIAVAFSSSRWRSSWDPRASDGDPSRN